MKPSQNQIGELLMKTIGLERAGFGTADSAIRIYRQQLLAWGIEPDGFVLRDGSGLSPHDLLTPETIVRVLATMEKDPDFPIYYNAMPIAGVDGTIRNRMKGTLAQGNIHAKTGTLQHAISLSGFVTTVDGDRLIFSILCNNFTTRSSEVTAVGNAIGAALASYHQPVALSADCARCERADSGRRASAPRRARGDGRERWPRHLGKHHRVGNDSSLEQCVDGWIRGFCARFSTASPMAPVQLPVVASIAAGQFPPRELRAGEAMRIMTGAPVPAGADSVIRIEDTDGGKTKVTIRDARRGTQRQAGRRRLQER